MRSGNGRFEHGFVGVYRVTGEVKKTGTKKRWFVSGFFILLAFYLIGLQTIPRFPFGPYKIYSDLSAEKEAAIIPYEYLSSEEVYPFVKSKYGDRQSNYDFEIKKWPNAQSCLIESEISKPEPDLRLLDWNKFKTARDVEVCLWRVFDSLNVPERAAKWLDFQTSYFGCEPSEPHKVVRISFNGTIWRRTEPWQESSSGQAILKGNWAFKDGCPIMVPAKGLKGRLMGRMRRGQSVRADFDDKNKIQKIEFIYFSML